MSCQPIKILGLGTANSFDAECGYRQAVVIFAGSLLFVMAAAMCTLLTTSKQILPFIEKPQNAYTNQG